MNSLFSLPGAVAKQISQDQNGVVGPIHTFLCHELRDPKYNICSHSAFCIRRAHIFFQTISPTGMRLPSILLERIEFAVFKVKKDKSVKVACGVLIKQVHIPFLALQPKKRSSRWKLNTFTEM